MPRRRFCSDTDASIPVVLPNLQTEVRLTRSEFEDIIRASIGETIAVLRRALKSAGVSAAEVSKVLLVGGSSRESPLSRRWFHPSSDDPLPWMPIRSGDPAGCSHCRRRSGRRARGGDGGDAASGTI